MQRDDDEDRPVLDLPVIPMDNGEARARFLELEAQQRLTETDEDGPDPGNAEQPNAETGISRRDAPAQ